MRLAATLGGSPRCPGTRAYAGACDGKWWWIAAIAFNPLPFKIDTMMRGSLAIYVVMACCALTSCGVRPARSVRELNACYEAVGLPDFMRPRVHWALRIDDGRIFDRSDRIVSTAVVGRAGPKSTELRFQPGVLLTDDEHKMMTIVTGDVSSGWVSVDQNGPTIILNDEDRTILQPTACR